MRHTDHGSVIHSGLASLSPEDVTQHIVSDCSFCASLAVCIAHNRRFSTKVRFVLFIKLPRQLMVRQLGLAALYPQDDQGLPVTDDTHMHSVRLLINGAFRRVGMSGYGHDVDYGGSDLLRQISMTSFLAHRTARQCASQQAASVSSGRHC